MRYPLNAHSKELEAAQEAREEEKRFVSCMGSSQFTELSLIGVSLSHLQAKEIEEGDEDADLDGPGDMDSF